MGHNARNRRQRHDFIGVDTDDIGQSRITFAQGGTQRGQQSQACITDHQQAHVGSAFVEIRESAALILVQALIDVRISEAAMQMKAGLPLHILDDCIKQRVKISF